MIAPFFNKRQMKVITAAIPIIKVVPRVYPVITDALTIVFENGMANNFTWTISKNLLVITFLSTSLFTQRENYSFTIFRGVEILYKGKCIFLKNGTDIQNYSTSTQDNKRWKQ